MGALQHITPGVDLLKGRVEVVAVLRNYPEWAVRVTIGAGNAGPVASSLTVFPCQIVESDDEGGTSVEYARKVPDAGVPSRALREIPVRELVEAALTRARTVADDSQLTEIFPDAAVQRIEQVAGTKAARPGKRGHGEAHYAEWARRYVEKVAVNDPHPIVSLAEEYAEETLGDRRYVKTKIEDARERYGFLTSAGRGRPGGRLTKQAIDVLNAERESRAER